MDASIGVDVGAVVGVGVNGQSVGLGVGLGVDLVVSTPPLSSFVLGSLSKIWESHVLNYHLTP